ncbi:hypothetical protein C1645_836894 [Glomus cerebriforme]|uniref:Uncharacterized protein n=1 Tax=Glomus cerebriforme TaxID=658196 RepID=A0A397S9K9_9GLOM|nr:hypothetical protein C1645_836894 [Glomus cerebriforme]
MSSNGNTKVNKQTKTGFCASIQPVLGAGRSSMIDEFIRETQLNANESMNYLKWIDFDQFDLIEYTIKRDAFSSIYSAMWMDGIWIKKSKYELAMVPLRSY